jgi:hypothetical protein
MNYNTSHNLIGWGVLTRLDAVIFCLQHMHLSLVVLVWYALCYFSDYALVADNLATIRCR